MCTIIVPVVVILSLFGRSSSVINLERVKQIESSGRTHVVSSAGAVGPFQFMKPTWTECCKKMKVNWDFKMATDLDKSTEVADFYLNVRIPEILDYYEVPVTTETILASYNAGPGKVARLYKRHGSNWTKFLPDETKNYLKKYNEG